MPRTSSEHLTEAELGGKQRPRLHHFPGVSYQTSPRRVFVSVVLALALGMIIFAPACSSTTSEHTAVLPGSRLDPKPIYSREALSVAVMAPSEEPLAEELPNGNDVVCAQRFHVIQTLAAGKLQAGNRGNLPDSLRLTYLCLSGERPIARDESVIWIADAGYASTSTGLKAWPDSPANRQTALRLFAAAITAPATGPGQRLLLPGSRISLADALAVLPSEGPEPDRPIVARCELTQEGMGETDRSGVLDFTSKAHVVQVLSGPAATGEVEIHYMVRSVVGEQEVHKGEKIIWVARIGGNRKIWEATKALADTPANRRLLERCLKAETQKAANTPTGNAHAVAGPATLSPGEPNHPSALSARTAIVLAMAATAIHRAEAAQGFSGKIVIKGKPGGPYTAALVLTNTSDQSLGVCTKAMEWRSEQSDGTWYASDFTPDQWFSDGPSPDQLKPYVVQVAPGKTVEFKMDHVAQALKPGATFKIEASYSLGADCARALAIWSGSSKAQNIIVHVADDGTPTTSPAGPGRGPDVPASTTPSPSK